MSSENCPSQSDERAVINNCGFKCKEGTHPKCVRVETGTRYICSETSLSCPPGKRRRAMLDKNDLKKVKVVEEDCPNDYYQPTHSGCYDDACQFKQGDIDNISESFLILPGNKISYHKLYCDYINGYYNAYGKTFIPASDLMYERDFCTHISERNLCNGTNISLLPNGTCVTPCEKDFIRNARKNFSCVAAHDLKERQYNKQINVQDNVTTDTGLDKNPKYTEQNSGTSNPINRATTGPNIPSASTPNPINVVTTISNNQSASTSTLISITDLVIVEDKVNGTGDSSSALIRIVLMCVIGAVCVSLVVIIKCWLRKRCNKTVQMQDDVGAKDVTAPLLDKPVLPNNAQANVLVHLDADHSVICEGDTNLLNRTKANDKQCFEGHAGNFKNAQDGTIGQLFAGVLPTLMQSVGVIIYDGRPIGTVFRVGIVYVMTAFHVVEKIISDPQNNKSIDPKRLEQEKQLFINFEASVCTPSIKYRAKLRFWDPSADVVILEITNPLNLPGALLLWQYKLSNLDQTHLLAVGFGHPNEPYEKHYEKCKIIGNETSRYTAMMENIEKNKDIYVSVLSACDASSLIESYNDYFNENIIKLDLFMGKGLSGGPVITLDRRSPKVVGMIIGGKPEFFYKMPLGLQDNFPDLCRFEVAMKMEIIYEKVSTDRELTENLFIGSRN